MSVLDDVAAVFDAAGIPRYVWQPIAEQESGMNPLTWNQNGEDSRGLFQINVAAHPQYAGLNLFDPVVNAQIALQDFIRPAWNKVKAAKDPGEQSAYVWRYGILPDWSSVTARGADQALITRAREIAGGGGAPAGAPGGAPEPTSNNPLRGEFWAGAGLKVAFGLALTVLFIGGGWALAKAFGADSGIGAAAKTAAKAVSL